MEIITQEKLNALLEEEERCKGEFISFLGYRCEGLKKFSLWRDERTGKEYAKPEIISIHMGFNSNEDGKMEKLIEVVESNGIARASWGVTGRTRHMMLAQSLEKLLPQYDFEIEYDRYLCLVKKRGGLSPHH